MSTQDTREQADAGERGLVLPQRHLAVRAAGVEVVDRRVEALARLDFELPRGHGGHAHPDGADAAPASPGTASWPARNARSGSRWTTGSSHSFSRFSVTWCSPRSSPPA